jgi:hypothetical protein
MRKWKLAATAFLLVTALAFAQDDDGKNELAFTLGAGFASDNQVVPGAPGPAAPIDVGNSVVFGASYARRLARTDGVAVYLEFVLAAAPSHRTSSANQGTIENIASLFLNPALQVKFAPDSTISPWVSGGFGYGLYEGSETLRDGSINPDRHEHTGALEFGGGVDIKTPVSILAPISLRVEVRDFYSFDTVNFGRPVRDNRQHNVVLAGGFLLRF